MKLIIQQKVMLTLVEYYLDLLKNNSSFKLSFEPLPLWVYAENKERIDWKKALDYLPFDFLLEHMPKDFWCHFHFESVEQLNIVSLDKKQLIKYKENANFAFYTELEFVRLFLDNSNQTSFLIFNKNIPTEWFVPLFPYFSINSWKDYVYARELTREQFDYYLRVCGRHVVYSEKMPFDWISVTERNFSLLFSHPGLTREFVQKHFESAREYFVLLLENPTFYDLGVQFMLEIDPWQEVFISHCLREEFYREHPEKITSKVFCRQDLTKDFIEQHKEKIKIQLNSRPSAKTLAWLKVNRPKAALPWLPLLELVGKTLLPNEDHFFRAQQIQTKEFVSKMTRAVKNLIVC